ncbi:MAG: rRNA maturation RNase YbeY [Deltaproteobacteria bacterium]|nr:rRNA maturation RNase YbeY [Deltaproteobacteria bacterium]
MLKVIRYLECEDHEISLLLVDDHTIQDLNREYLGRDKPTNVISFGMREGEWQNIQPRVLGDIVISVETALRDAQTEDIDIHDEILFLFIHGLLHLLGYDHENGVMEDAMIMMNKEMEIFKRVRKYPLD